MRQLTGRLRVAWLVACIFAIGAVSAYWYASEQGMHAMYRRSPYQVDLMSVDGLLMISCGRLVSQYSAPEGFHGQIVPFVGATGIISPGLRKMTWFGFYFQYSNHSRPNFVSRGIAVCVPYWFLFGALVTTTVVTNRWLFKRSARGFPVIVKGGDVGGIPTNDVEEQVN